ncbi:hypothetical protein EJB05_02075, partial [Eragrostis curvula]
MALLFLPLLFLLLLAPAVQELYEAGVRRVAVMGMAPLGTSSACTSSDPCVDNTNSVKSTTRTSPATEIHMESNSSTDELSTIVERTIEVTTGTSAADAHMDLPTEHTLLPSATPVGNELVLVEDATVLTSLAACAPTCSSVREATCADVVGSTTAKTSAVEICRETSIVTAEMTMMTVSTHISQNEPMEQMWPQVVIHDEDVVLVEDASDDEEVVSDVLAAVEDPILLVTTKDDSIQPTIEVTTEHQTDNPTLEATSSSDVTAMKGDDPVCFPMHPTSPPTNATRRRRKSYDRSSLRRSARIAHSKVLKDLSIMGNDGKLDEDRIKVYADCLKELLPPDLLISLMSLKDRAFWDVVAGIPLPLR